MNKLKVGDSIIFLKVVNTYSSTYTRVCIPKYYPVLLVSLTRDHVVIMYEDRKIRLRNIPKRMAPAGELSQAIFGA